MVWIYLKLGSFGRLFNEEKREINGRNGGNNLSANLTAKNSHHDSHHHHHSSSSSSSDESLHRPTIITNTTTEAPSQCDDYLNLLEICNGCGIAHTVSHPNCQHKYKLCNAGMNSIQECSLGLLFDNERLTCDYAELVG